ncbi:hypothetical protein [Mycoplasma phocimorsus]|uniref:hypothetical protein n=1 Tax=Mycoplasma phocimorsus TaxID=3045839 RepID=UPI0024C05563|nr:hypothetical protein [Mycoplasma phocimorsus]MDJ1649139.1 hypothetical protein [Mycoplasma phocimorsus]
MNRLTKFISVAMVFPGVGILISCTKINKNTKQEENFNQNKNIKNSNKTKINNDNNSPQNPYKTNKQKDNKLPVVESTIGIEKHVEPYEDVIDEENTDILITNNIKNKKRSSNWFSNLFANKNKIAPITIGGILGGASLILGFVGLGFLFEKVIPQTKYGIWSYSFPSKVEEVLKSIFDNDYNPEAKNAASNLLLDILRISDKKLKETSKDLRHQIKHFFKNKKDVQSIKNSFENHNFITEYFNNNEKQNNSFISIILEAIKSDNSGKTAKDFIELIYSLKIFTEKQPDKITQDNWYKFIFTDNLSTWQRIDNVPLLLNNSRARNRRDIIQVNNKNQEKVKLQTVEIFETIEQRIIKLQSEPDLTNLFNKLMEISFLDEEFKNAINKYIEKIILFLTTICESLSRLSKFQKTTKLKTAFTSFIETILFILNKLTNNKAIDHIRNPLSISMKELSEIITKFLTKNW